MATTNTSTAGRQQKSDVILDYLRPRKKFPSVWCAGCGNGVVMSAIIRAIDRLGYARNDVVLVSGIGCSSRMPVYLDFNALHTTHGRALPFATGVKFANPRLKVIVITGDGDALAIGGNHFIHACRRNIDINAILINNYIYGMTGGQGSPTTPSNKFSTTTPYGNVEKHFEPCDLARAAGASYVGRATVYHAPQLEKLIMGALEHRVLLRGRGRGRAERVGAGAVRAVATRHRAADVDDHRVTFGDLPVRGHVVWAGPVGSRRHDREVHPLVAGLQDGLLDVVRDFALGPARSQPLPHACVHLVDCCSRRGEVTHLGGVLAHPRLGQHGTGGDLVRVRHGGPKAQHLLRPHTVVHGHPCHGAAQQIHAPGDRVVSLAPSDHRQIGSRRCHRSRPFQLGDDQCGRAPAGQ